MGPERSIILASSSPRRKSILSELTENFVSIVPQVNECVEGSPDEVCILNATLKGEAIKEKADIVIACDTVVSLDDKIYGKPEDKDTAYFMLKELSGKTHSVFSGLYVRTETRLYKVVVESKVTMKELEDDEIEEYIEEYMPLDKAGAYAIQDDVVVESYEGDYNNIVGLPKDALMEILGEIYGEEKGGY